MSFVRDNNERVEFLRIKQATGTITPDELNELKHSHRLVGNGEGLPVAFPAYQFTSATEWASHFNGGSAPEVVTVDDTHDAAPQGTNDDELEQDEREALDRMLRDLEKKR